MSEQVDPLVRSPAPLPARDQFRRVHRYFGAGFYACNIDLALIEKYPVAGVVAYLDFKKPDDRISFTEVITYLVHQKIAPVYLVRAADPSNGPFQIAAFVTGDWQVDPPICQVTFERTCETLAQLRQWEYSLRKAYRSKGDIVLEPLAE